MSLIKQPDAYSCGPTCVANALYLLGNGEIPVAKIKRACGTRWWNGTDETGLRRGLRKLGYYGVQQTWLHKSDGRAALAWVREQHARGRPVILCVDNFDHWVLAGGSTEKQFFIQDPYEGHRGGAASHYTNAALGRRWWCKKQGEGCYYAVAVKPNTRETRRMAHHAMPLTSPEVLNRLKDSTNDLLPVSSSLIQVFGSVRRGKNLADLLQEASPYLTDRIDYWWAGIDRARIRRELRNFVAFARGRQLRYLPAKRDQAIADLTVLLILHSYYRPEEL